MLARRPKAAIAIAILVPWRGMFITLWPRDIVLGWIWPARGFGAWHLPSQVIRPSALGPMAHVVTDASGLLNVCLFIRA